MKIYSAPSHLVAPQPDRARYDAAAQEAADLAYKAEVKKYIIGLGYDGPNTGKTVKYSVADGYALYMIVEKGKSFGLMHLDMFATYSYPYINRQKKSDVMALLRFEEATAALIERNRVAKEAQKANA